MSDKQQAEYAQVLLDNADLRNRQEAIEAHLAKMTEHISLIYQQLADINVDLIALATGTYEDGDNDDKRLGF